MTAPWYLTECHCMHGVECHACHERRVLEAKPWCPDWFTPSKLAPALSQRVARGLHPFGLELGPPESTCGTCAHLVRREFSKTYLKCALAKQTRGPATDVRVRWRGCTKWEPKP